MLSFSFIVVITIIHYCYHSFVIKTILNSFSCVLRVSTPCCWSVRPLVRQSVRPLVHHTLLFWRLWGFWLCCSCRNAPLTSIMAPAHPHATRVAVYPALFLLQLLFSPPNQRWNHPNFSFLLIRTPVYLWFLVFYCLSSHCFPFCSPFFLTASVYFFSLF